MMRPLVAVDVGNSSIKVGWFAGASEQGLPWPAATWELETQAAPEQLQAFALPAAARWRVASVHREAEERLGAWVRRHRPADDYRRLSYRDLPLAVRVQYPDRVGMDRLAAAVAANQLRSRRSPALVVDAGTAITVDWVDAEGAFQGGVILPGVKLAAAALAEKTDLLPLVEEVMTDDPPPVLGQSTEAAIRSGLFWGAVGAVREIIARLRQQQSGDPQVFITGGGARQLARHLEPGITFVPHLVLCGVALADAKSASPPAGS